MMSVPGSVVHCIIVFYRFEWMVVRISSHSFAFPEINLSEKKKLKYMKIKNLISTFAMKINLFVPLG